MRQIYGIFTAMVTAVLIIFMAQMIKEGLYPQPTDLDYSDKDAVMLWLDSLPSTVFIIIAISHGLAIFSAALVASLVSSRFKMTYGIIVASVIFSFVIVYLFTYNFPVWFVITDTCVTVILGFTGSALGSSRNVG